MSCLAVKCGCMQHANFSCSQVRSSAGVCNMQNYPAVKCGCMQHAKLSCSQVRVYATCKIILQSSAGVCNMQNYPAVKCGCMKHAKLSCSQVRVYETCKIILQSSAGIWNMQIILQSSAGIWNMQNYPRGRICLHIFIWRRTEVGAAEQTYYFTCSQYSCDNLALSARYHVYGRVVRGTSVFMPYDSDSYTTK